MLFIRFLQHQNSDGFVLVASLFFFLHLVLMKKIYNFLLCSRSVEKMLNILHFSVNVTNDTGQLMSLSAKNNYCSLIKAKMNALGYKNANFMLRVGEGAVNHSNLCFVKTKTLINLSLFERVF